MEVLEEDVVALMRKRVYDLSGVLGKTVKVQALYGWTCLPGYSVRQKRRIVMIISTN